MRGGGGSGGGPGGSSGDRDNSPNTGGPIITINGGSSYRSDTNDMDDGRDRDRYQSSYMQKMKERSRSDYKKDKYATDKRDRRDRNAEHRTNHDRIDSTSRRSSKMHSMSSTTKFSPKSYDLSDRDRSDRDFRDRDRDRDRDRGDKLSRFGDWSEHVSSSGKKYYYNCKTEVSQWEKPKEWLDKERYVWQKKWNISESMNCKIDGFPISCYRNISKEPHRDYRDKERDKDREDRFSRSCKCE